MKIKVNSVNEYEFYPLIGEENDALPQEKKFCVVLRRLSIVMHSGRWAQVDADSGQFDIDLFTRVREHIVRLENAPLLTDENENAWDMTIEDLTGDKYPALYSIVGQINAEINRMDQQASEVDEKK